MKSCLAMLLILAGGCATIIGKTDREVTFTSTPPGAKVSVESKKPGRYYSCTTPGTIKMSKKSSYFATFSLDGYHSATYPVDRAVGKNAAGSGGGNLLLLGILAPIGIGIDAASGAAATLPNCVNAELVKISDPPPPNVGDAMMIRQKLQIEKDKLKKEKHTTKASPSKE